MSPLEEPILTGKTIAEKARALDREVQWMAKKAKSWRPKPPPKEEKKEEAKDEEKKEDGATAEDPKADEETQNEDSTEEKSNDPTHEEL